MDPLLTVLLLFGFLGAGTFFRVMLGKINLFNTLMNYLSKFIYYILLPVVFIDTFAKRGVELADINIVLIAIVYVAISIGILMKIPISDDSGLRKAITITSIFQNNVFLGFPVLLMLLNDISAAAMYSLIIFILHISVAGLLAAGRGNIVVSVLKIPIIYGFLIGTFIHYTMSQYYETIAPYMSYTHSLLSYSAVYILGYTLPLTFIHVKQNMSALYLIGVWRFIISPLIHFVLLSFLTLPSLYWKEIMILSIMPPAVMNTVIARIYNWKPELVASITLILTLISMIIIVFILLFRVV